jgi:hypothetical protein
MKHMKALELTRNVHAEKRSTTVRRQARMDGAPIGRRAIEISVCGLDHSRGAKTILAGKIVQNFQRAGVCRANSENSQQAGSGSPAQSGKCRFHSPSLVLILAASMFGRAGHFCFV